MNNIRQSERGAVLVTVAVLMLVLIGFLGLAIDAGYAYLQKTRLQSVADAQVLACVVNPSAQPCPAQSVNLYSQLDPYGFNTTILNPGDTSLCLNANQTSCAQARTQTSWNTFFIGLFGVPKLSISAVAVAGRNGDIPSCVVTTAQFSANGTNQIALNNCSASIGGTLQTTNQSGISIAGMGSITVFNGNNPNQCGNCSPDPVGVSTSIPDLPSSTIPTLNLNGLPLATLPYTACTNSSCIPAIYTGGVVTLTTATTLQTGNYVFNGGFSNGGNTLNSGPGGVSLFIPGDQTLSLSGTINLTAPSPANCKAGSQMVISHPYNSSYHYLSLNGSNVNLQLTGVINLSADDVSVGGSSAGFDITGSFVAHSLSLNGNMNPQLSTNPCFNLYESTKRVVLLN